MGRCTLSYVPLLTCPKSSRFRGAGGADGVWPDNAIPIKDWVDDRSDEMLLDLLPFLEALSHCKDVRSVLSLRNT